MATRHPQPAGALIERPEETRRRHAELLARLAAVCVGLLAALTQALLQSEGISLGEKAALRLTTAALAPIARRLEALAAEYRDGLPEPDEHTLQATYSAALDGASGPPLTPPPRPVPHLAAASAPAAPILWPRTLARPLAGSIPPLVAFARAALHDGRKHVHIVPISQL